MNDWDRDLLGYLPEWFRKILDFQEICKTEQEQMEALALAIHAVAGNFFFQEMDASAVAQWENIFGIVPNPAGESLEFRRARLLNRVSTRPPFTLGFLYQKLDELIGPGLWTVEVDYPNYTFYVESAAENQQYANEIAVTIGTIKPCHMVYVNRPYLRSDFALSEQIGLTQLTYHYKLGGWGLGMAPFASEQDKGVIKLPSQKSIQTELLAQTAAFVAGDVASARINGLVGITGLTKSSDGPVATITYTVLEAQAPTVTQVELLDAQGQALTSSGVYVPILGNAVFKHVIPVKEAV